MLFEDEQAARTFDGQSAGSGKLSIVKVSKPILRAVNALFDVRYIERAASARTATNGYAGEGNRQTRNDENVRMQEKY